MNLKHRSYEKELLDHADIPFEDIERNMHELDTINSWLGGHAITLKGLRKLVNPNRTVTICEIGCGNGNNLRRIAEWSNAHSIGTSCIGIDIKEECINAAKQHLSATSNMEWIVSDYRNVSFTHKPDIIFSSLFCHHFTNTEIVEQLMWMRDNCKSGFFINDLHRHWFAYKSISILTKLFSSSYLVKNDAPLSVARGFLKAEWENLCRKAGLKNYSIEWMWAFRYLVTFRKHEFALA